MNPVTQPPCTRRDHSNVDPSPTGLYLPSYSHYFFGFSNFLLFRIQPYVIMHPRCACFVLAVTITVCLEKMWLCVPSFCRSSWMERNKGNLAVNCSPLIECDVGISGFQPAPIQPLEGHGCSQDTSASAHQSDFKLLRYFILTLTCCEVCNILS